MVEKLYRLGGLSVRVEIMDGLVRIVNDCPFKQAVAVQPEVATRGLIAEIKADYGAVFSRELNIHDDSLVVEIWGHLYGNYLLSRYRRVCKIILFFGLYDRFRRSCEVIDCGESKKDPNRWLWDMLVPFRHMLGRQLAKVRLCRFTER